MLKIKITSASVRTAACPQSHRIPSTMSWRTCGVGRVADAAARASAMRDDQHDAEPRRRRPGSTNGHDHPGGEQERARSAARRAGWR